MITTEELNGVTHIIEWESTGDITDTHDSGCREETLEGFDQFDNKWEARGIYSYDELEDILDPDLIELKNIEGNE